MTPQDEILLGKFLILYPLTFYIGSMFLFDVARRVWRARRKNKAEFLA